jgi:phage protein D
MPTGKFSDRFASREQKTAVHEARVQESHKVESEMAERSKGQPSTRIPEKESERKVDHEERQQERVHHIQRTTELTKEQLGEQ